MIYVQFFQKAAWPVGSKAIVEACGDRSVVILDGRNSGHANQAIAKAECIKRGYVGWQLFSGESFTRSKSIGGLNLMEAE